MQTQKIQISLWIPTVYLEPVFLDVYVLSAPRCEKTGIRGFRPGPKQTGLYSHRR